MTKQWDGDESLTSCPCAQNTAFMLCDEKYSTRRRRHGSRARRLGADHRALFWLLCGELSGDLFQTVEEH
jgi:hypothetical protein